MRYRAEMDLGGCFGFFILFLIFIIITVPFIGFIVTKALTLMTIIHDPHLHYWDYCIIGIAIGILGGVFKFIVNFKRR